MKKVKASLTATVVPYTDAYDGSKWIKVVSTWNSPVDRPEAMGFQLKPTHRQLAERLVRAIEDGVVFTNPTQEIDVFGRTYIDSDCKVLGRTMNADLNRLGY